MAGVQQVQQRAVLLRGRAGREESQLDALRPPCVHQRGTGTRNLVVRMLKLYCVISITMWFVKLAKTIGVKAHRQTPCQFAKSNGY